MENKDLAVKKASPMMQLVELLKSRGYSQKRAEVEAEEVMDRLVGYYVESFNKEPKKKDRKHMGCEELFRDMLKRKSPTLRG